MQDTKLLDECKAGNIDAVRSLITDNANLNAVTDEESPLLVAIEANNLDLVDVLLQAGADPARVTDSGETALMAASRCGHLEIVYHLLQRQPAALLNIRDDELEHTALLLAIKHNKLDVASALFDAGADATIASDCGTTTLMVCSDVPLAEKLLDLGVDVHAQDGEGMNAFLIACRDGNVKMVSLLLARGADVYSHDGEDRTGLMLACSMGHAEVATVLLKLNTSPPVDEDEWNAWLHSGDRDGGVTALHMAVLGGHAGCVQALVDAGFKVNKLDDDSVPPLSHAVNAEIARILLDAGAKDLQGGCRKRAVVLACEEPKRIEVLRLLLQRFPNCDHPDRPLLFFAVEARNLDAVRALVTARPPEYINKQDSAGCTALAYARHPEVVQLLLELGTDPRIVNNTGKTPLMFGGSAARVRLLLEAAPDTVRVRDNAGRTAMSHLCLSPRHLDALDELLRYCAEFDIDAGLNEKDSNGDTALHIAAVAGNLPAVKLLREKGADMLSSGYKGTTGLMKPFLEKEVVSSKYKDLPMDLKTNAKKDADSSACLSVILDAMLLRSGDAGVDAACDGTAEMVDELGAKRRKVE